MKIIVTGASGFVGSHTITALLSEGHEVVGLSKSEPSPERRRDGNVRYLAGVDVSDPSSMSVDLFSGVDAVVHLVGIIVERPPRQTFSRIHVQGTRNVVDAARKAGVGRIVYVSAIGAAPDAAAEYSRTKFAAEEIMRASGIDFTILRPSIILGTGGEFVAQMRDLVRFGGLPVRVPSPLIPVPGSGMNLFQPVFVDDLTRCIFESLAGEATRNQTFDIGGAERVNFNQVIQAFEKVEAVSKPLLHVPLPLLSLISPIIEQLPKPPFTGDQLKNLRMDNVADLVHMRAAFGFEPIGFEDTIKTIYAGSSRAA